VWIAENAKDLLAQANIEYAEWLEDNPPARNPVGWLLTCAYRRALNLLDTQSRKPRPAPLDSVFHLADESMPTPEQQALDRDRQSRLQEALRFLPKKECKLLALVYFEDLSIREAGRKLGWQKSAADRHHNAALEKLKALVGDRALLSPATLGLAAWTVAKGEGSRPWAAPLEAGLELAREGLAVGVETVSIGAHRAGEAARRLAPFSEPGNAAAAGGAGRVAGQCGVAAGIAVCGLLGAGPVTSGMNAILSGKSPDRARSRAVEARPASAPVAPATLSDLSPPSPFPRRDRSTQDEGPADAEQPTARQSRNPQFRFPVDQGEQSTSEFGDNNFEPGSPPPVESSPPSSGSSGDSSGSSGGSSSGSAVGQEFGF
jgi:RNA polymerase sigma factor (sigma-70 family)